MEKHNRFEPQRLEIEPNRKKMGSHTELQPQRTAPKLFNIINHTEPYRSIQKLANTEPQFGSGS